MALVADVFKVIIMDSKDNVLAIDSLADANVSSEVETSDVNGGGGLIAVLHGQRSIEISLTDPKWRFENLALHMGADIVTGAGVAYAMPVWKTVEDNAGTLSITLDNAPKTGTLKVYMDDGTELSGFTISGNKVTFSAGVAKDDKVEVRTYQYDTAASTETINIDINKFPADCKLVLETLEISESEVPLNKLQYQFDRAKPSANFSINTTTSREASNTETTFRILKPEDSTQMGRLLRIPLA